MGVSRKKGKPVNEGEREYAYEAFMYGVDLQAAWREFLEETIVAVPGRTDDESWDDASGEDEEALNRRAARQAAQDLKSADFEVRWAACRDLAKLQRAAAPYMQDLADLVATEQEFDVKRVAKKSLQALRKADLEGWPTAPVRPEKPEADVGELEAAGIPLQRLRSVEVARRLLKKLRKLQRLDLGTLQHEYLRLGVPLEPGMGKGQLLERLSAAALWSELELEELERECEERGISVAEGQSSEQLAALLLRCTCERAWEGLGVSPQRLGSFEAAAAVIHRQAQLEPLGDSVLQEKFLDRGLLLEPDVARAELLRRLRLVLLWEALPLEQLQPHATSRQAALEHLLFQSCESCFAARGVPAARLGSMRASVRLCELYVRLEAMGEEELDRECERLCIVVRPAERLRCAQLVALWGMLPSAELAREWTQRSEWLKQRGVAAAGSGSGSEVQQRKEMQEMLQLSLSVEVWEAMGLPLRRCGTLRSAARLAERWGSLEAMGAAELAAEAERFGVPGLDLGSLKRVAVWLELTERELQKECLALGVNVGGDDREQLLQALKRAAKESWAPASVKHLRVLGLGAGADADDVRRAFRQLALKHHPDKNPGRAQEEAARAFREVREAYDALCKEMGGLERS